MVPYIGFQRENHPYKSGVKYFLPLIFTALIYHIFQIKNSVKCNSKYNECIKNVVLVERFACDLYSNL